MFVELLTKVFGTSTERIVKQHQKKVDRINALEPELEKLSDEDLKGRTQWFKDRLAKGETLDDILAEAFATVREASKRALNMRHFDVQMVGGIVLHQGNIAEMKTGEGKTLVATLPVYLNALTGRGVHVVTVNDYLATRDSNWKAAIYNFLGLSVGCIVHGLSDEQRREAYASDITYGTNNELGFDYLRDNMKFRKEEMVQRDFNCAIVDEVDSILIDEARTPLIISGPAEDSSELYKQVDVLIPKLIEEDYEKDEKQRSVTLTEKGIEHIEQILNDAGMVKGSGLYDPQNIAVVHHVNQALKAHKSFSRDVDYVVKDDQIILIDEFTGRMMEGRRYSEGLHQAIEAKENVTIQNENQTLASITYQNYFRLYDKLSGMTGTALTEAAEFEEIYNLKTVDIPTNVPVIRKDDDDEVYLTADEKYESVIAQIKECQARKQPVLVGTTSIEKSDLISDVLKKAKIDHQVLNARYHEQESMIIANAGQSGAVTIATNMAGRGTDIKLGGNLDMRIATELGNVPDGAEKTKRAKAIEKEIEKDHGVVLQAGGLYVIGTERHESRRVDNQLRGRSGRQGDPGASKFYVSLEDDLMRIFGSENLQNTLKKLGVQKGEAITHKWITKALEKAQQKVEARNFDIRKHLLRYDDVMNDQRKVIYAQRRELMEVEEIKETIDDMREEVIEMVVNSRVPEGTFMEQWDLDGLHEECVRVFGLDLPLKSWAEEEGVAGPEILRKITEEVEKRTADIEKEYGAKVLRNAERMIFLQLLDRVWKDHLLALDQLRQGINLRAYAQSNPLNEYKREAFALFEEMLVTLKIEVIQAMSHFQIQLPEGVSLEDALSPNVDFEAYDEENEPWLAESDEEGGYAPNITFDVPLRSAADSVEVDPNNPDTWGKVPRNSICPCGSEKKFKHCHGKLEKQQQG